MGQVGVREQKVVLMRYVRTKPNGWVRRRVRTGSTRGWEQRIDTDLKWFGPDVIGLGDYQIRWYDNRKTRYESGGDTYSQARVLLSERRDNLNLMQAAERARVELPKLEDGQPLADRLEP